MIALINIDDSFISHIAPGVDYRRVYDKATLMRFLGINARCYRATYAIIPGCRWWISSFVEDALQKAFVGRRLCYEPDSLYAENGLPSFRPRYFAALPNFRLHGIMAFHSHFMPLRCLLPAKALLRSWLKQIMAAIKISLVIDLLIDYCFPWLGFYFYITAYTD